jgi:hypothetical protein
MTRKGDEEECLTDIGEVACVDSKLNWLSNEKKD